MRCSSVLLGLLLATSAVAQPKPQPVPALPTPEIIAPYEPFLLRLSEILGGMQRIDELCINGGKSPLKAQMQALIDADQDADRRAHMAGAFNQNYRSVSESYPTCTDAAGVLNEKYRIEALKLIGELKTRYAN